MAIHPNSIPSAAQQAPAHQQDSSRAHDIEAWTQQTTENLRALHLSATMYPPPAPNAVRGTSVPLHIPLDDPTSASPSLRDSRAHALGIDVEDGMNNEGQGDDGKEQPAKTGFVRRRSSIQRDSLRRRELLLKGKEGSRRRQRWENDRLLNVPNAQPPLPADWEVRPTHPVRSVPYFLASLWDERAAKRPSASRTKRNAAHDQNRHFAEGISKEAARIQKELRAKMKKSKGAKNLLMDLEETVRAFIQTWEEKEAELERSGAFENVGNSDSSSLDECVIESDSSDDEEIVFVGRDLATRDLSTKKTQKDEKQRMKAEELRRDILVYEGLLDDHGAAFGRWLVHSIGVYYGLKTWSVTSGVPARREAYVGIVDGSGRHRGKDFSDAQLPKPLWATV